MVRLGQKVEFNPLHGIRLYGDICTELVTGTVIFINEEKRWFMVEYDNNGIRLKIGFHFNDIGKNIELID